MVALPLQMFSAKSPSATTLKFWFLLIFDKDLKGEKIRYSALCCNSKKKELQMQRIFQKKETEAYIL
jgi:hypothetical protein